MPFSLRFAQIADALQPSSCQKNYGFRLAKIADGFHLAKIADGFHLAKIADDHFSNPFAHDGRLLFAKHMMFHQCVVWELFLYLQRQCYGG